jgi:hypothetical protein
MFQEVVTTLTPVAPSILPVLIGAVAVPTILIGWLHVRLNSIHKEQATEIVRLDERIKTEKDALLELIEGRYVTKDTLGAKFETISEGIKGIHHRMDDFIKRSDRIETETRKQGERIARVEVRQEG